MLAEYVRFALKSLKSRKLRSWLTMLGIFIGIAAVVALMSLGQGLKNAVTEAFDAMGTDKVMIFPGSSFFSAPPGALKTLTLDDVEMIKRVKGVKLVSQMVYRIAPVEFKDEVKYTWATGIPLDNTRKIIEDMQSIVMKEGRMLAAGDRNKAVVGIMFSDGTLFDNKAGVKDKILVNGKRFSIVGVLDRIGNNQDDSQVLIPLEVAREVYDEPDVVDAIILQVSPGIEPAIVAENIKRAMRRDRGQKEGEEDFSVQTTEQLMESYSSILDIVQYVLVGIAAISLLVGGVGITNTMYTAVLQRRKEIGIMKAIGAKNSDILILFLLESGFLGLAGGIIGIIIGVSMSKGVEIISQEYMGQMALQVTFPFSLIFGAMAFSYIVGSLAGILPAMQAAKMHPVDALRS